MVVHFKYETNFEGVIRVVTKNDFKLIIEYLNEKYLDILINSYKTEAEYLTRKYKKIELEIHNKFKETMDKLK
jgi:hypothetical protein